MDQNNNKSPVKKPEANIRKKRKPLMEKRRRARINASLEQLKKLVLDATRRDSARYSKLEKADILELTVRHLREVQRNNINFAMQHDPTVIAKFGDGFGECATEVGRYLSTTDGISKDVHTRLMGHLSNCTQNVNHSRSAMASCLGNAAATVATAPATLRIAPPCKLSGLQSQQTPSQQSFLLNQHGGQVPMYQSTPSLTGHCLSPTSPTLPSPSTPCATPVAFLPGNQHHHPTHYNVHMQQHSPISSPTQSLNSPPHNIHEHFFHSQFSTTDANARMTLSNQQEEGSSQSKHSSYREFKRNIDNKQHVLHEASIFQNKDTKTKASHGNGQLSKQKHFVIKSEPVDDNFFHKPESHILFEHARFMESVHFISRDNVWRPW